MPPKKTVLCHKCKHHVLESYFSEHLSGHRKPTRKNTQAKESDKKFNKEIKSMEEKLDATNLYSDAYREQGKYGSHPSHDDFDDESNP